MSLAEQLCGSVTTTAERVLPSRNEDPIARLEVHYFLIADLMLKNERITERKQYRSEARKRRNDMESLAYTRLWLSLLYDICKEFEREIETQIRRRPNHFVINGDLWTQEQGVRSHFHRRKALLADFCNAQFHFQKDGLKQVKFFADPGAIIWAEELHQKIAAFFSSYRVQRLLDTRYLAAIGRQESSNLVRHPSPFPTYGLA